MGTQTSAKLKLIFDLMICALFNDRLYKLVDFKRFCLEILQVLGWN